MLKTKNLDYDVLSDDSGLCCEALNLAPGIYSARYAGEHGNSKANRDKLQKELKGKNRDAYFNCTIVVYYPNALHKTFNGKTYFSFYEFNITGYSINYGVTNNKNFKNIFSNY